MNRRPAPLTTTKIGSVRCNGCEKRFADTPGRATLDLEVTEGRRNRYGGFSDGQTQQTTYRWHADCHAEFTARNDAYRAAAAAQHEQEMRDLCAAAGVDYDQLKKEQA